MATEVNFKVRKKIEKVFKNIPKDIPLSYEMSTIIKLAQEMYELGHADGYAECYYDNNHNK